MTLRVNRGAASKYPDDVGLPGSVSSTWSPYGPAVHYANGTGTGAAACHVFRWAEGEVQGWDRVAGGSFDYGYAHYILFRPTAVDTYERTVLRTKLQSGAWYQTHALFYRDTGIGCRIEYSSGAAASLIATAVPIVAGRWYAVQINHTDLVGWNLRAIDVLNPGVVATTTSIHVQLWGQNIVQFEIGGRWDGTKQ
ncbi:MAG: hypothetical protein GY778_27435, partial [bacterium]|nr:hypothetical protein [bacterium]